MTIQFTVPAEYVAAVKARLTQETPGKIPTDSDVIAYVSSLMATTFAGYFPNVVLPAAASAVAQLAVQKAQVTKAVTDAFQVTQV